MAFLSGALDLGFAQLLLLILLLWSLWSFVDWLRLRNRPFYLESDSRCVPISEGRVRYLQRGTGPDLVLIHGIGANVYTWRFLAPLLERQFRVTQIDLFGFGASDKDPNAAFDLDSQADRLWRTLQAIGVVDPVIVGSSMGGLLSIWLLRQHSSQIRAVIGLAPAAAPNKKVKTLGLLVDVLFWPLAILLLNSGLIYAILRSVVGYPQHIHRESIDYYMRPYVANRSALICIQKALATLTDPRIPEELKALGEKVMIVEAQKDPWVDPASLFRLQQIVLPKKFVSHSHSGHHIQECEPAWTAEQIELFLKTLV